MSNLTTLKSFKQQCSIDTVFYRNVNDSIYDNNLSNCQQNKRFSRKQKNDQEQITSVNFSRIKQKSPQCQRLIQIQKLQNLSFLSGRSPSNSFKFIRTNTMSFLSPQNKQRKINCFSPDVSMFSARSMIQNNKDKKQISFDQQHNGQTGQKQQISSNQSIIDEMNLKKSLSSNTILKKDNQTRNMILSKFNVVEKQNKIETKVNQRNSRYNHQKEKEKQKQHIKNLLQKNKQLKQKNTQYQNQLNNIRKINQKLKAQILKQTKKVQTLIFENNKLIKFSQYNNQNKKICSANYLSSPRKRFAFQLKKQQQLKCYKREQKQKIENMRILQLQKNLIKKQNQINYLKQQQKLKMRQYKMRQQQVSQLKIKIQNYQQTDKISKQNGIKMYQFIDQLKQQINQLQSQLRYLKIQNLVLLRIKNQNLKLKIDITKAQDERDYFKIKVMQINKKNTNTKNTKNNQNSKNNQNNQRPKAQINLQPKKFYLDSTQTDQLEDNDCQKKQKLNKKCNNKQNTRYENDVLNNYLTINQDSLLFDLTSEESQNSI